MAEKLLKRTKQKIAAKAANGEANAAANGDADSVAGRAVSTKPPQEITLVGTYKENQLAWIKKNGVYNYPVKDGDEFDATAFGKIKELWLYAGSKGKRHCFAAEFVGKMTRDEFFASYPTYANLVFKTLFLDYGPKLDGPIVLAREKKGVNEWLLSA